MSSEPTASPNVGARRREGARFGSVVTRVLLATAMGLGSACNLSHRMIGDVDAVATSDGTDAIDELATPDGGPDASCDLPRMLCGGECVAVDLAERCGSCLNDCRSLPGTVPLAVACRAGRCDLTGACARMRADCNMDPTDGCESDIESPDTCTTACLPCPPPPRDGRAQCFGGMCVVECDRMFRPVGNSCLPVDCGNRVLDGTEACDDGNNVAGDGCSASCDMEPNTLREDCAGLTGAQVIRVPTGRSIYSGTTELHVDDIRACMMGGPDSMHFFVTPVGYVGPVRVELRARMTWDIVMFAGTSTCPGACIDPGHEVESWITSVTGPTMFFIGVDSHRSSDHGPYVLTLNLP